MLPRGDCNQKDDPAQAALRILFEEAGVFASQVNCCVGTYTDANKKGKIVAHNWMYEVHDALLLETWPSSEQRKREWVCKNGRESSDVLIRHETKRMRGNRREREKESI